MKKLQFLIILTLFNGVVFSLSVQDLNDGKYRMRSGGEYKEIIFSVNSLSYKTKDYNHEEPLNYSFDSEYSLTNQGGLDYIVIKSTGEKWLILSYLNEYIMLYDEDGFPFFEGTRVGTNFEPDLLDIYTEDLYTSNSYLTEKINGKTIKYDASNFTRRGEIPYPWVEGEDGYGIGAEINGLFFYDPDRFNEFIFFSNGYVSYERPDLYNKNSRVKKISVTNCYSKDSKVFVLEDNPNFQLLNVTDLTNPEGSEFIIKILEVYEGEKYKDTCINLMAFYIEFIKDK